MTGQPPQFRPSPGTFTRTAFQEPTPPTSTFQDIIAALLIPEELMAKGLGQFTDNPKYDQSIGNFHRMVGFQDIFAESLGPGVAAASLGLAAGFALDPLMLGRLGRATKAGVALDLARAAKSSKATRAGQSLLREVATETGTLTIFNRQAIDTELRHVLGDLDTLRNSPATGGARSAEKASSVRTLEQRAKELKNLQRDFNTRNQLLIDAQKSRSFEEIIRAPKDLASRIRSGEASLLGVASPFARDAIPFRAPAAGLRGAISPLLAGEASARVAEGLSIAGGALKAAGAAPVNAISRILRGGSSNPAVVGDVSRALQDRLMSVLSTNLPEGDAKLREMKRVLAEFAPFFKDSDTQKAAIRAMEKRFDLEQGSIDIAALLKLTEETPAEVFQRGIKPAVASRTAEEQRFLNPPPLEPAQVSSQMDQWRNPTAPARKMEGGHQFRLTSEGVVIRLSGKSAIGKKTEAELRALVNAKQNKDIPGIPNYRVVVEGDEKFLVAATLPSANILNPDLVSARHLTNLGNVAAQLSKRKASVTGVVGPRGSREGPPVLVSSFGGVQILQPDILLEGVEKSGNAARTVSEANLRHLTNAYTNLDSGQVRFPMLESQDAARGVSQSGYDFVRSEMDASLGNLAVEEVGQVSVAELMKAENMAPFRNLNLDDPAAVQRVANATEANAERMRIRQTAASGVRPETRPIQYMMTPDGRLLIVDGVERIAAASAEGFSTIPVLRKPFFGEAAAEAGAYFSPYSVRGADILAHSVDAPAASRLAESGSPAARLVDSSYRILDESGNAQGFRTTDFAGSGVTRARSADLLDRLGRFATRLPGTTSKTAEAQARLVTETLTKKYGSAQAAAVKIAQIADESADIGEFAARMTDELEVGLRVRASIADPSIAGAKARTLAELQKLATEHLDDFAARGILLPNASGARARLAAAGRGTVVRNIGDTVIFTSVTKTADELAEVAQGFFKRTGINPADVHHVDEVLLETAEGTVRRTFNDFVEGDHPRIWNLAPRPAQFVIDKPVKAALKAKNIIHVPPGTAGKLPELDDDLRIIMPKERDLGQVWFKTSTGDLFIKSGVAPNVTSVAELATEVFGQATMAMRLQEWGFIVKGRVVVSNPLGGMMETLSKSGLVAMEKRIKEIAGQFVALGANPRTNLDVVAQFSDELWKKMYRRQKRAPTLEHVLSDSFKLTADEADLGSALNILLDSPQGAIAIRRTALPEEVGKFIKWAEDNLEDAARRDLRAGQDVWVGDYFPRFMDPKTREFLNDNFLKWIRRNEKARRVVNASAHLKHRTFDALSAEEIEQIFAKTGGDLSDILNSADSAEQLKQLQKFAELFPGGFRFYYSDPLMASFMRIADSFRREASQHVIEELRYLKGMKDPRAEGVFFIGNGAEFEKASGFGARIDRHSATANRLNDEFVALKEQRKLIDEKGLPAEEFRLQTEKLDAQIAAKEEQLGKARLRENESTKAASEHHPLAGEMSEQPDTVWIKRDVADRLLKEGRLREEDFLTHPTGDMVRVPFSDSFRALIKGSDDIEIMYTNPEVAEVLARIFGLSENKSGQWGELIKGFDSIQNFWKQITLFPIPQSFIRDSISDMFLMMVNKAWSTESMSEAFQHMQLLRRFAANEITEEAAALAMRGKRVELATGQSISMQDAWDMAIKNGVVEGQFVYNDFSTTLRLSGGLQDLAVQAERSGIPGAGRLAGQSLLLRRGVVPAGRNLRQGREIWFKFGAFLEELKRTGDPAAAGLKMKQTLYDYRNLSTFERSVMRRIIPFYAWMRFNIPGVVRSVTQEPVLHARVQGFIRDLQQTTNDGVPVDPADLPEWLRNRAPFITRNKDGSYHVKALEGFLPVYDLLPIMAEGPLTWGSQAVSPLLKLPFEQLFNKSALTGRDIEDIPGQPARSGTLAALGQSRRASMQGALGFINVIWNERNFNDLFRLGKQFTQTVDFLSNNPNFRGERDVTIGAYLTEMSLGRSYDLDPRQTMQWITQDESRTLGNIKRLIRQAKREGNNSALNYLKQRQAQFELSRPPR